MRLLLDTHILLWWMSNDHRLSVKARQLITESNNEVLVSAASIWEMAVKAALGKLKIEFSELEQAISAYRFVSLPITAAHAARTIDLPLFHNDPFDRILIAQSKLEAAQLVTHDSLLHRYGSFVMVV